MLGAFHRLGKEPAAAIQQTLDEVYDLFPVIARLRKRYAGFTSGGEQQILAIGRALMAKPRLLLLDEPSMGLSPILTTFVAESLMTLRATGLAMVLVEQNVSLALQLADRAIVMETGHPALQGTTDELRENDEIRMIYLGQSTAAQPRDDAPTEPQRRLRSRPDPAAERGHGRVLGRSGQGRVDADPGLPAGRRARLERPLDVGERVLVRCDATGRHDAHPGPGR